MKTIFKIPVLFLTLILLASCNKDSKKEEEQEGKNDANNSVTMESVADKFCKYTTETQKLLPKVMKLSIKAINDKSANRELEDIQERMNEMGKELEVLEKKYENDKKFQEYLMKNCKAFSKLSKLSNSFEDIEESLEDDFNDWEDSYEEMIGNFEKSFEEEIDNLEKSFEKEMKNLEKSLEYEMQSLESFYTDSIPN